MSFCSKCHCCIASYTDFSLDYCGAMRQGGLLTLGLDSRRTVIHREIFIYYMETTKIKMPKREDSPVTDRCMCFIQTTQQMLV